MIVLWIVRKSSLSDNAKRGAGWTKTVGVLISLESWQRLFRTRQTSRGRIHGRVAGREWKAGSFHDPEGFDLSLGNKVRGAAVPKFLSKQAVYKPDLINKKQTKGHAKAAGRSADGAVKTPEAVC